jgi:3-hydroxybutyryl-CoA dehydratase
MRFKVGDGATVSKTVTEADVIIFSGLTGDFNQLSMNEAYAGSTIFKKRVVHNAISAGIASAVIGNKLPGKGALTLGQSSNFVKPVFVGDTLTAVGEILSIDESKSMPIMKIRVNVKNQHDQIVTECLFTESIMEGYRD